MIYTKVKITAKPLIAALEQEKLNLESSVIDKREAIRVEDSKRRDAEMKEEIRLLQRRVTQIWGEISAIEEEVFRNLLSEEYGLPRSHPKFDKVYSYAWQQGHSAGFSEVEGVFMDVVELVK